MKAELARDEDWAAIESLLPPRWRDLALMHGVRMKPRPELGAKLSDAGVLIRLILHHACTSSSLKVTAALAAALGVADISAVALHKWMCKAGPWLSAVVSEMLQTAATFSPSRWAGYEVIAVDATTVQRPGATGTSARVHVALRLSDLRTVGARITSERVGETLRNFSMSRGQLWIADRGYSNTNSIAHAIAQEAEVLIRFAFGPLPLFDKKGDPLDVRAFVSKLESAKAVSECRAWVHADRGEGIEGRVVAIRLPPEKAEKARARLKREKGAKISADTLRLAQFVVLFTTVPASRLTAPQLIELYRLRWQIELGFKRDKSIAGLDRLPNFRDDTIQSWIAAKMLGVQLARRLAEPAEPFPPSIIGYYALRPSASRLLAARSRVQK